MLLHNNFPREEPRIMKQRIPHCRNSSKIQSENRRKKLTHNLHDRSISWLDTGTSIKSGRIKLVVLYVSALIVSNKICMIYIKFRVKSLHDELIYSVYNVLAEDKIMFWN
jgi:hypothetical protein